MLQNIQKSILKKTVLSGILIGAIFPGLASLLQDQPSFLFLIICTAPIVLGIYAYFIGKANSRADEIIHLVNDLKEAQKISKIGSWDYNLKTRVTYWSDQMHELFNLTHKKIIAPFELKNLIYLDDQETYLGAIQKCLTEKLSSTFRIKILQNNQLCWVEFRIGPQVDTKSEITGLAGTFQDITEVIKSEEKLEEEKLKSIQNAKLAGIGELSANIAHEINNPLAIILGNAEILKDSKYDPEKLNKRLDAILKSSHKISKIVHSLKRAAHPSQNVAKEVHNLMSIIDDVMVLAEAKAKRHDVELIVHLSPDQKIWANNIEMEQVFINLINNAIDAVKDLEERWIKIESLENDDHLFLRIIDSGKGIKTDLAEKIFNPFFTTKPVNEGTGLGLSITKTILESHGAEIQINHRFENTCFEIIFPLFQETSRVNVG